MTATWHTAFDASRWLLLPDMAVLEGVRDFVSAIITARKSTTTAVVRTYRSRVSPSVLDVLLFSIVVPVASGIQDKVQICTSTRSRARTFLSPDLKSFGGLATSCIFLPDSSPFGVPYLTPNGGD